MSTTLRYTALPPLKRDAAGFPVKAITNTRWQGSGRVVQNNKGKSVKAYEPFYSSTWRYESEKELTDSGISPVMHYDAMGREARVELPFVVYHIDGVDPRYIFGLGAGPF